MLRTLLIFIVGVILFKMVARLLNTVQSALPGDEPHKDDPLPKGKIIDAEFEDLDEDD